MSIFQEVPPSARKMHDLHKFLNQYRCEKGVVTHTSMRGGKYHIPVDALDTFYQLYEKAMVTGIDLHLTEKPLNPSRMRVDLDFRFAMPNGFGKNAAPSTSTGGVGEPGGSAKLPRLYNANHICRILEGYSHIFTEYLDVGKEQLTAYVMEKGMPSENRGKLKDGLHIVWPDIVVSHSFMHLVRKHMLEKAAQVFAELPLSNTHEDVIDQAIIDKNNWQMYGSKKVDSTAYRVTHIFQYDPKTKTMSELPPPSALDELKFVRMFAMHDHSAKETPILDSKKDEIEQYIRHVLPTIDERRKNKLHEQIFNKSVNLTKNYISDDELELARQLVRECLKPARAENYEDWIKLGWTLRNIDYRLLDTWVEFSRVSSKYVEGECQKLWNTMRVDTMGIGTIRWWARDDNPIKYQELMNQSVIQLIDRCIGSDGAHYNVAEVVHAMYKDRYRFTSKDVWYMFKDEKHRWVRSREGLQLRLVLSNEVCSKFMERALYWTQEASKITDATQELYHDKVKKLNKISIQLKSAGYKDSVMKECKSLFTDEKFEELLDSHPHLLGFENGVYDLRMHEFREGLPDDYISFSTGRHYMEYDPNTPEAKEIQTYFSQVFTNENVRKYMMDLMACIIDGGIRQEKFYIFTGSGCHAIDTPIMMASGQLKMVQDVKVGDALMGDDGTPRNVLQLCRGNAMMYRITPVKGEPFEVNGDHVLTLKYSNTAATVSHGKHNDQQWFVRWYEMANSSEEPKEHTKSFTTEADAIHFKLNELPTTAIRGGEVFDIKVNDILHWNHCWFQNGEVCLFRPEQGLLFWESKATPKFPYTVGKDLIIENSPHIPDVYKYNCSDNRTALFAGLFSTGPVDIFDGRARHCIIDKTNETLADDIEYLAKSLGFAFYKDEEDDTQYRLTVQKDDKSLLTGFNITPLEAGDFYGFELDGNHRYLMGDFTVTHNSNSKSIMLNFLQKAIGEYYCILPIALLTQKRTASNSAQSELERTKGRRLAVMQEPGNNEELNIGLMKEISGGDRILVRGLYKEPVEFRPQFKMVMTCNDLPDVRSNDNGTWRRLRVVDFNSRFTDNPNPAKPNEFPLDPELTDKIERWADTLVTMIIHHHKEINPKTIVEPVEVSTATNKYRQNNDVIGQYIDEHLVADESCTERVGLLKIYNAFKVWAGQVSQKGKKLPDRNQFRDYMAGRFGAYPGDGKGWRGIRILNRGEDDADSDVE